ncbi:MAG: hypothetical protein H6Q20_2646 [Bacteroidetes bacterium]|nr:hypothetical protein [Bacteroidota bacterium]
MIHTDNGITVIICDKCGARSSASSIVSNEIFFNEGWTLQPRAKKYQHTCRNCQTEKQRRAHNFVAEKFGRFSNNLINNTNV